MLDAAKMRRIHQSPALHAPTERYHLETKPAMGGALAIERTARVKAPNSAGILLPSPSSSEIFVFPVSTATAPATKNMVSLPKAWAAIANPAPRMAAARPASEIPVIPGGRRMAAPRMMYESWLTVE